MEKRGISEKKFSYGKEPSANRHQYLYYSFFILPYIYTQSYKPIWGLTGYWSCQLINRNMLKIYIVFHCSQYASIHLLFTPTTWDRINLQRRKLKLNRLSGVSPAIQQKSRRRDTQFHDLLTWVGVFTLLSFNINISLSFIVLLSVTKEQKNYTLAMKQWWSLDRSTCQKWANGIHRNHIQDVPPPLSHWSTSPTGLWKLEKSHKCPVDNVEATLPRAAPSQVGPKHGIRDGGIQLPLWVIYILRIKAMTSLGQSSNEAFQSQIAGFHFVRRVWTLSVKLTTKESHLGNSWTAMKCRVRLEGHFSSSLASISP